VVVDRVILTSTPGRAAADVPGDPRAVIRGWRCFSILVFRSCRSVLRMRLAVRDCDSRWVSGQAGGGRARDEKARIWVPVPLKRGSEQQRRVLEGSGTPFIVVARGLRMARKLRLETSYQRFENLSAGEKSL